MEIGIPYTLVGQDGARVVWNNPSDPDFVGFLDPDDGLAGFDMAEHSSSGEDRVEAEGGTSGTTLRKRRPGTLKGIIWPEPDIVDVMSAVSRIKRASRGLTGDAILTWQPSADPHVRMLRLRRQLRPVIGMGRRPKTFLLPMICASHLVLSAAEFSATATPAAGATIVNAGDDFAPAHFRLDGPMLNPVVRNQTTGREWRIARNLATGQFLIVRRGVVLLGGVTDAYESYDRAASKWWDLAPGANAVTVTPASSSAGAGLTVFHRHAWE